MTVPKDKPEASQIDLRNMFLLGPGSGEPTKPGQAMPLYGVLINQVEGREDRLVAVSSRLQRGEDRGRHHHAAARRAGRDGQHGQAARQAVGAESRGHSVRLPTGTGSLEPTTWHRRHAEPVQHPDVAEHGRPGEEPAAGDPGTGEQPLIVLSGLTQELIAGSTVPVRLQFEHAGAVEFQVPVVPHQQDYLTYPLATPSAPASGSPTPGRRARPAARAPARPASRPRAPRRRPAEPRRPPPDPSHV